MSNSQTKVLPNEYNGKKMFTIAKVDFEGNAIPFTKPVINMGIVKAKAVLEHMEELKTYVKENS